MHASAKTAFFASIISAIALSLAAPGHSYSAPQVKELPAGIGAPAAFDCSDRGGTYPTLLVLDGAKAKAIVSLKNGTAVELEGTHSVEISGPGTRITGMPIHTVTLDGANGAKFSFALVENHTPTLWGNGILDLSEATPITWLGSCYPAQ